MVACARLIEQQIKNDAINNKNNLIIEDVILNEVGVSNTYQLRIILIYVGFFCFIRVTFRIFIRLRIRKLPSQCLQIVCFKYTSPQIEYIFKIIFYNVCILAQPVFVKTVCIYYQYLMSQPRCLYPT